MMNAWNLAWVIPLCVSAGYVFAALLIANKRGGQ